MRELWGFVQISAIEPARLMDPARKLIEVIAGPAQQRDHLPQLWLNLVGKTPINNERTALWTTLSNYYHIMSRSWKITACCFSSSLAQRSSSAIEPARLMDPARKLIEVIAGPPQQGDHLPQLRQFQIYQPCPAVRQLRLRFGQRYRRFTFCKELG
mgnify:CR=1 FL=1